MLINLIGGIYHRTLLLLILCACWERGFLRLFGSLILQLSLSFRSFESFLSTGHARESNGISADSGL